MLDTSTDSPITRIVLGPHGRILKLNAVIKTCHLRPIGAPRRNITARVTRFVDAMGRVVGGVRYVRDSDENGHVVGDSLSGPHNRTYNFFPQSPYCNMQYYHRVEKEIYDYLSKHKSPNTYVELFVEMLYEDIKAGLSPNRPIKIGVTMKFSNGTTIQIQIDNL